MRTYNSQYHYHTAEDAREVQFRMTLALKLSRRELLDLAVFRMAEQLSVPLSDSQQEFYAELSNALASNLNSDSFMPPTNTQAQSQRGKQGAPINLIRVDNGWLNADRITFIFDDIDDADRQKVQLGTSITWLPRQALIDADLIPA